MSPPSATTPPKEEQAEAEEQSTVAVLALEATKSLENDPAPVLPPPPAAPLPLATAEAAPALAGPTHLPDDTIEPRRLASAGEKGQGWPYAPKDWPNPGDVWSWRVGQRFVNDFWQDRYLYPPKSFCKEGERSLEFASKKGLKDYLLKHYPSVDGDDFFCSFQWRVPAKFGSTPKRGPGARRDRLYGESSSAKKSRKRCKADNPNCTSELLQSSGGGPKAASVCEICCAEPDFCRDCNCILCCKVIEPEYRDCNFIRCLQRSSGGGACGHAAHLECALDAELAGVVKTSGIDMEYLCRRCDNRSDLRDKVTTLLESVGTTSDASRAEKMLSRAFRILEGTSHGGPGGRLLEKLVQSTLQQIQAGVPVERAFKSLAAQAANPQSGRSVYLPGEGMLQSEVSFDQWLHASNTSASLHTAAAPSSLTSSLEDNPPAVSSALSHDLECGRGIEEGSNARAGVMNVTKSGAELGGTAKDFAMDHNRSDTPLDVGNAVSGADLCTQSSRSRDLSGTSLVGAGLSAFLPFASPSSPFVGKSRTLEPPPQVLATKLNKQIHEALLKLRDTSAADYELIRTQLHLKRDIILIEAQEITGDWSGRSCESAGEDESMTECEKRLLKLLESYEEFVMMLHAC